MDENPSAFPRTETVSTDDFGQTMHHGVSGMDLRDYFAAKALPSLLLCNTQGPGAPGYTDELIARAAYNVAEAMLEERARRLKAEERERTRECESCGLHYGGHRLPCPLVPSVLVACAACGGAFEPGEVLAADDEFHCGEWVHVNRAMCKQESPPARVAEASR